MIEVQSIQFVVKGKPEDQIPGWEIVFRIISLGVVVNQLVPDQTGSLSPYQALEQALLSLSQEFTQVTRQTKLMREDSGKILEAIRKAGT